MNRCSIWLAERNNDNPRMRWMQKRHRMVEIPVGSKDRRTKTLGSRKYRFIVIPESTHGVKDDGLVSA